MRDALSALSIPSVYLSNRDSVFDTPEAKDLLWLLQAVLAPEQERTLRSAMATGLMGLDAPTLDGLSRDERARDALVNEFDNYRTLWLRRDVLPMLSEVMKARQLAENLLASAGGERRLTDVLHRGAVAEAAAQLDSEHALVRWLAQQIAQPNRQSDNQQLRLESDRHLVQVITIHKSRGWNSIWCGCRSSAISASSNRRCITIAIASGHCWISTPMKRAGHGQRRSGWRKTCVCCTWR